MTTLPAQYSASELFWLYRSRWQIERLIKAMKQLLSLVRLRSHQPEPIHTTLLAWMLVWIWQLVKGSQVSWRQQQRGQLADLPAFFVRMVT